MNTALNDSRTESVGVPAQAKYLSKQAILDAKDVTYADVDVPEWGGTVRIKALTGEERDGYEQSLIDMRGNVTGPKLVGAQARLVALAIVDDDGNRYFETAEVKRLAKKSSIALKRVFDAASKLSGLTEKDMQELLGNSDSVQSEPSTTDSPSL